MEVKTSILTALASPVRSEGRVFDGIRQGVEPRSGVTPRDVGRSPSYPQVTPRLPSVTSEPAAVDVVDLRALSSAEVSMQAQQALASYRSTEAIGDEKLKFFQLNISV